MTEEVKPEGTPADTPEVKEAPQHTDIELRAMERGWRPQTEWDGEPDDFVDAKEYLGRQPLFDKIQSTTKALKETNKALEAFKNHYTKVKETEYNRALKTLQEERASAVANGDGETFQRLDTEIKAIEVEAAQIKAAGQMPLVPEQPAEHPAFASWKNRNQWYETTGYMKAYADEVGVKLARQGVAPEDVLKQVEQAVRKEFPHRFTNPNKANAPSVDTSRGKSSATSSAEDGLTAQEKQVMNTLIRGGHITKEKYLADLKNVKEQK